MRRGRSVTPTETGRQLHGVTTRFFALQEEARALLAGEQALTRAQFSALMTALVPVAAAVGRVVHQPAGVDGGRR